MTVKVVVSAVVTYEAAAWHKTFLKHWNVRVNTYYSTFNCTILESTPSTWRFYQAMEDTMGHRPWANNVNEEMAEECELQVWMFIEKHLLASNPEKSVKLIVSNFVKLM